MDSVPNEITAQGLRRVEGRVDSEELARSAHGHIKTGGQVDFKDPSADDKELRRASGVEKRVHDSLDHAAARREQASSAEVEPQHHDRRPGFRHTPAAGSARSQARNPVGVSKARRSHKGENLGAEVAEEERTFKEERAGIQSNESGGEEEEAEETAAEEAAKPEEPPTGGVA